MARLPLGDRLLHTGYVQQTINKKEMFRIGSGKEKIKQVKSTFHDRNTLCIFKSIITLTK